MVQNFMITGTKVGLIDRMVTLYYLVLPRTQVGRWTGFLVNAGLSTRKCLFLHAKPNQNTFETQRLVNSIHEFKVEGIEGEEIDFARFKGKKIIVVNVASECGFTPQYQQLQELYEEFKDKMAIVGFPCNDFGGQEPGTGEEIWKFCSVRYGVRFPLASKISILDDPAPVYRWLTRKDLNGVMDSEVRWNFQKYLLDESGQLVNFFPSTVSPLDEPILNWITS